MAAKHVPERLSAGSHVRVVAPSQSLALVSEETRQIADARLAGLGLEVSFGAHVEESDRFSSTSIEERIADLHAAFADPDVDAILTVIGGYNANQLLPRLDWDLIGANPKIFCGFSDITILTTAIQTMTGLVTFLGPHYSTFGMRDHFDQTLSWFTRTLFAGGPVNAAPAQTWTADAWYVDQDNRQVRINSGHWVVRRGKTSGYIVGGNLSTFNLLQGTMWMPDLTDAVVFVEDDGASSAATFARDLTSLTQQEAFYGVSALIIGRFEPTLGIDRETVTEIVKANPALRGIPVVANVDFGHTDPMLTLPIGGTAVVEASRDATSIDLYT